MFSIILVCSNGAGEKKKGPSNKSPPPPRQAKMAKSYKRKKIYSMARNAGAIGKRRGVKTIGVN